MEGQGPPRELLDRAIPDRPAYMVRIDGHSAWANTAALAAAGVGAVATVEVTER